MSRAGRRSADRRPAGDRRAAKPLPELVKRLPPELLVDASRRGEAGIMISLRPRAAPPAPPARVDGRAAIRSARTGSRSTAKEPLTGLAASLATSADADGDGADSDSGLDDATYRVPLGPIPAARIAERALRRYGAGWALPGDGGSTTDRLRTLEYVVVDVETTGGSHRHGHRITEVAAVRLRGDGARIDEYTTLINPRRPIPPFITSLTRITWDMVARAPHFEDIADELRRFLAGAVFVAHNASFDWRFLSHELRRVDGLPLRGRVLCTVRLARRVVPEIRYRSLDALQYFFGIENEARHRAWGDARATALIFRRLLDRVEERDIERWEQLDALLGRVAPRRKRRAMPGPVLDF